MQNDTRLKILFLSSNPKDTYRIRLDEEYRKVEDGLERSKYRDKIVLKSKWATRIIDLRRAMLDFLPDIVHFCGHGEGVNGIFLEDENGNSKLVSNEALSNFFELFSEQVKCVLLNACHTIHQANTIGYHIDYVIGMSGKIEDKTAIEFAVAFYDGICSGNSIDFSFKIAINAIQMEGNEDHILPTLIKPNFKKLFKKIQLLKPDSNFIETRKIAEEIANNSDKSILAEFLEFLENSFFKMSNDPTTQYWIVTAIGEPATDESLKILHKLSSTKRYHALVERGINDAIQKCR